MSATGFALLVLSLGAAAGIFAATVGWVTLSRERARLHRARRPEAGPDIAGGGASRDSDDTRDDTHSKQQQS